MDNFSGNNKEWTHEHTTTTKVVSKVEVSKEQLEQFRECLSDLNKAFEYSIDIINKASQIKANKELYDCKVSVISALDSIKYLNN